MLRTWMIAAVVLVLLAGGCAVHGVRASAPLARYPAVFFEGEPSAELRSRLDSVYNVGRKPNCFGVARTTKRMVSGPHPLLEAIAPGARCVTVRWFEGRWNEGTGTYVWWNDRLYGFTGLNQLLLRAGVIGGDTCDVFLVSKLAVLLYEMDWAAIRWTNLSRAQDELRPLPSDREAESPPQRTAFPAIVFDSLWTGIRTDTFISVIDEDTVPAVRRRQGVWLDVTEASRTVRHFVAFSLYNELMQPLMFFVGDAMRFLVPVRAFSPSGEEQPRKPSEGEN